MIQGLIPNGRCSGCEAPIHWAKTVGARGAEKPFPANVQPDPERGNVLIAAGIARVLTLGQIAGAKAAGEQLYTSHFATCPRAADFRRAAASRNTRVGGASYANRRR